jgi:hypothetical protein
MIAPEIITLRLRYALSILTGIFSSPAVLECIGQNFLESIPFEAYV